MCVGNFSVDSVDSEKGKRLVPRELAVCQTCGADSLSLEGATGEECTGIRPEAVGVDHYAFQSLSICP